MFGLFDGGGGQQHGELIPTQPTEQVVAAHHPTEPLGDPDEQGVAHAVATPIVDALEPVQVHHQQGHRRRIGPCEQAGAPFVQVTTAGQAGHMAGTDTPSRQVSRDRSRMYLACRVRARRGGRYTAAVRARR